MITDLRSDTVTHPTPGMLEAMWNARVGDDVFGEDPTIRMLEEKTAAFFGFEAGLFCPSGTMTNQIAIKCHTQPGDEVICEELSHVYIYEGGGIARNSHCQARPLKGNRGQLNASQVVDAINPDFDYKARTRLVCLENTTNRGGGSCYSATTMTEIADVCRKHGLGLHLDGARIWNALVAKQEDPLFYGSCFDSVSVCFSKGMGTPVGSVLIGNQNFIREARRVRKVMGGGMRQAGYLAAAGIYAIDHHINRLVTDHTHARLIASSLEQHPWIASVEPVETNIVIATTKAPDGAAKFAAKLAAEQVFVIPVSPNQVRFVTHLDISEAMIERLIQQVFTSIH